MLGLISLAYLVLQTSHGLPDAYSIRNIELKIPLRVYSADGLLISEFGDERRKPTTIKDIPVSLIAAVLASEDNDFYQHGGIDFSGLVRAALSNFRSGATQQGASTITMQVARNFFLSREKTYYRKLREVLLAIKLEQILSKDEILSLYLNKIFLGHRAYGFGAAAAVYYDRELDQLSLAETAMLAGLPKAPSAYNPLRDPERAKTRRNYVLNRMRELGKITQDEFYSASNALLTAKKYGKNTALDAPHIAEMVRAQLTEEFGEKAYWRGLNVYTTILSKPQQVAEKTLRAGLQAYDQRHGFRGPIKQLDISEIRSGLLELDSEEDIYLYYSELLRELPNSQEQIPALVTSSDELQALVWAKNQGEIILNLAETGWARKYLTANLRGDKPKSMRELVSPGDIVYIQPVEQVTAAQISKKPKNLPQDSEAEKIVHWRLSQIPNISGALISIEPESGRVLSLVGGYDFFLSKFNRAVQSIRQPGSNIKPFIYSASLDKGFTPASLISGAPIVITDPTHGTVWRPENYSGKFFGPTRMRTALSKSLNLVSIRLLRAIGIPYARAYVERFGIDISRFSSSLTMALGSGGVTPMEMVSAYATLANTGYKVAPYFIEYITDRDGKVIYRAKQAMLCDECYQQYLPVEEVADALNNENPLDENLGDQQTDNDNQTDPTAQDGKIDDLSVANDDARSEPVDATKNKPQTSEIVIGVPYDAPRVMSADNNYLIVSMLKDVVRRGTARKALVLNRQDLAGKTGTTNDYIDAWFSGFNSKIATTVWVGCDEPATMGKGEAGSKAALPIWVNYMRTALEGVAQDSEELPPFIEQGWVNRVSGERTDEMDPMATIEYFPIEELLPHRLSQLSELERVELERQSIVEINEPNSIPDTFDETINQDIILDDAEPEMEQTSTANEAEQQRIIETDEETEGLF